MLSASTPCGWENSAVSMATVRLEEGAQHLGIDGSEKQAEVSGRIGIGEHRHRSETEVSMRKRKWRCQESLLSQAQWQRPDTVTQERCRCKR